MLFIREGFDAQNPSCSILLVGSARIELAIFAMSRQRHDP
jgi:hypothetical protein